MNESNMTTLNSTTPELQYKYPSSKSIKGGKNVLELLSEQPNLFQQYAKKKRFLQRHKGFGNINNSISKYHVLQKESTSNTPFHQHNSNLSLPGSSNNSSRKRKFIDVSRSSNNGNLSVTDKFLDSTPNKNGSSSNNNAPKTKKIQLTRVSSNSKNRKHRSSSFVSSVNSPSASKSDSVQKKNVILSSMVIK